MINIHDKQFKVMIEETAILDRLSEIATSINTKFREKEIVFLSVLNGSFMVTSDLAKMVSIPCSFCFVKFSSYDGTNSTGTVTPLIGLPSEDYLQDKHVIIVEDIIDTGRTMKHFLEMLTNMKLASLSIFTLLFKEDAFEFDFRIDYTGFNIPDKFVVGYGLDYNEHGRNLKHIYQITD